MQRFLSTKEQKRWPGCLQGLRTTARKANEFGFRTQTGAPERAEKVVRAPAGFAYECPQSQWIRFSYANRGTGKSRKGGPGAGRVCVRVPAKPMDSVFVRKPGHRKEQKRWPGCRQGLRTSARKANGFGFRTQTGAPERAEKVARAPAGFAYECPQSQ